ncbi:MAG: diguanylate cyclase [Burkholderiales bacterium]|nr:diguanylate cyclase [Burkholderiales bacterium]
MSLSVPASTAGFLGLAPFATISAGCALVLAVAGLLVIFRERGSMVGWIQLSVLVAAAVWQASLAMTMSATTVAAARPWATTGTLASILIAPLLVQLTDTLALRRLRWSGWVAALWGLTAIYAALLIGGWALQDPVRHAWGMHTRYGPAGMLFAVSTTIGLLFAIRGCRELWLASPAGSIASRRGWWLMIAVICGSLGGIDYLPALGLTDFFPVGGIPVAIAGLIHVYAAWRFRLPEVTPNHAARRLLDMVTDGVVVLDGDGVIRFVNPAACAILGYAEADLLHAVPNPPVRQLIYGRSEGVATSAHERVYEHPSGGRRTLSVTLAINEQRSNEVASQVATIHDVTNARIAHEQIHKLAFYDALTGLPNRLLLRERLAKALNRAGRAQEMAAVMFLDLDRFKQVNDTLGHDAGDQLLRAVSERITSCVRESDLVLRHGTSSEGPTLARLGGDEFVLLLSPIERAEAAAKVARRILQSLAEPVRLESGTEVSSSVSIGISLYPTDGEDSDTLLKRADFAMYHAKENGRNNLRFFDESINAITLERLGLETSLQRALRKHEFLLLWQPVLDLRDGSVYALDAQVWWNHPREGLIPERAFADAALDAGLALPLGEWVVRTATFQIRSWDAHGLPSLPVMIGVTPSLLDRGNLPEIVRDSLSQTRIDPRRIMLCVRDVGRRTERARVGSVLAALNGLGVTLVLDDFGTGALSVGDLITFPFDRLRMRASLLGKSNHADAVTAMGGLIGLARGLGRPMIAADVDDREVAKFLLLEDCPLQAGAVHGAPVAAEDLPPLLQEILPDATV